MTITEMSGPILVLLSPSLVSQPAKVEAVLQKFPKNESCQHQVLDRVENGGVILQPEYYSQVHLASEDGEAEVSSQVVEKIFATLQPGGTLSGAKLSQSSSVSAIITGFVEKLGSWTKPEKSINNSSAPVVLKRSINSTKSSILPKFKKADNLVLKLDLNDDDDGEDLIDENELLDGPLPSAIKIPEKCQPPDGKRRRKACKDCTCGLKELELQEEEAQRAKQSNVVSLSVDDTAELDFTVPGKATGSCGSCALGDAFRCDGCPYLGLPPFKPGQVVSLGSFANDL
jgi:anamorsin